MFWKQLHSGFRKCTYREQLKAKIASYTSTCVHAPKISVCFSIRWAFFRIIAVFYFVLKRMHNLMFKISITLRPKVKKSPLISTTSTMLNLSKGLAAKRKIWRSGVLKFTPPYFSTLKKKLEKETNWKWKCQKLPHAFEKDYHKLILTKMLVIITVRVGFWYQQFR